MMRTTYGNALESLREFAASHRRLLIYLLLLLCGVALGVAVFAACYTQIAEELTVMLEISPITGGFQGGIAQLFSSCLSVLLLLAVLFLAGLCPFGAPVTALVPLFFGMGLGLTEAYYYAISGGQGVLLVALLVLPRHMLAGTAILMGCAESLRMSLLLSRQLLPSGAMGGLFQDFRLYVLRFLLLLGLAFASGVLDILLRVVGASLLT